MSCFISKERKKKKRLVMPVINELVRYTTVPLLLYAADIIWNCPCFPIPLCHYKQVNNALWGALILINVNLLLSPDTILAYFLKPASTSIEDVVPETSHSAPGDSGAGTTSD